jgi:glycosyltransferase involved in cell wall biosynthesis
MSRSLSVILPVHNQGDHIAAVIASHLDVLRRVWTAAPYELLLVTNGCTDDSVAVCTALSQREPAVRTIDLPRGGWGRAVRAGLAAAEGDILCYTNSARTTSEMLALMLAYSSAYPDVVLKANRRIRESFRRRLGSLFYNLEARALFDLAVWDINGTPKIFPRSFDALVGLEREDDLIDLEFVVACRERDYPVVEIPLLATTRHGGSSTTNYGSALRMYRGALQMRRARGAPR